MLRMLCSFTMLASGCLSVNSPPRPGPSELASRPRTVAPAPPGYESTAVVKAPVPDQSIIPASAQMPTEESDPIQRVHAAAEAKYAALHSYIARLRRRQSDNGQPRPEELILFKFRKEPWSLHMKWIEGPPRGREVLFVKGQFGDKINVLTGPGDVPFTPAGKRMSFARDSALVRAVDKHDIAEAGLGHNLKDLASLYADAKNPKSGVKTKYLGPGPRPEFPQPMEAVEITLPPGRDIDLPRGGIRRVLYEAESKLPLLYLSYDELGREFGYNVFDRLQTTVRLDNDDFNPDKLWGPLPEPK